MLSARTDVAGQPANERRGDGIVVGELRGEVLRDVPKPDRECAQAN